MELAAIIVLLVGATYAVNILKLRMVVRARAVPAAALEGVQGFLYVYVLVRVLESTNTAAGVLAYVAGASLGTLAAMLLRQHEPGDIPGHYHPCCPPVGPLALPAVDAAGAHRSGGVRSSALAGRALSRVRAASGAAPRITGGR